MNRVRQTRQEQLERYDLGSMLDDIRERLQDSRRDRARRALSSVWTTRQRRPAAERAAAADERTVSRSSRQPRTEVASRSGRSARPARTRWPTKRNQQLDELPHDPAGADPRTAALRLHGSRSAAEVPGAAGHAAAADDAADVPGDAAGAQRDDAGTDRRNAPDDEELNEMLEAQEPRRGSELRGVHAPLGPLLRTRHQARSTT